MHHVVCWVAIAWLAAGGLPSAAADRPLAFCPRPLHDFGQVIRGSVVEHTFTVENRGSAPLVIQALISSCSCTTAPLTQEVVDPGGRLSIPVRFDSAQFSGEVHKSILLVSNDPDRPELPLELAGTVQELYVADPSFILVPRLSKNAPFERKIVVRGRPEKAPRLRAVSVEGDPGFLARFGEGPAAGEWTVSLALQPGQAARRVSGTLIIALDDPLTPTLRVPFAGQLLDDVDCFPKRLDFGRAQAGEALTRKAFLLLHNPQTELGAVTVTPSLFDVRLRPRSNEPGRETDRAGSALAAERGWEIELRVKGEARAGAVDGRIEIRTSSPDQPLLVIPLHGLILAP